MHPIYAPCSLYSMPSALSWVLWPSQSRPGTVCKKQRVGTGFGKRKGKSVCVCVWGGGGPGKCLNLNGAFPCMYATFLA